MSTIKRVVVKEKPNPEDPHTNIKATMKLKDLPTFMATVSKKPRDLSVDDEIIYA